MAEMKDFHIGDVLSITTGRLLSPRHMEGVYDLLNWMTGDNLYTHQLPRVSDEARPHLLGWHPFLAEIDASDVTPENWRAWLSSIVAKHGEYLTIEKMPAESHERIDPVSELAEKIHPSNIIAVMP